MRRNFALQRCGLLGIVLALAGSCGAESALDNGDTDLGDLFGKRAENGGASSGRDTFFRHGTPSGSAPWTYVLTSYGGPDDSSSNGTPACGGKKVDGNWYYATGAYTFGCGSKLKLTANGKCVVVKTVDNGPADWVESKCKGACGGSGYIIDASPMVSRYLFGTSSAGWSDCKKVQVSKVDKGAAEGPCQIAATPPKTTPPKTTDPRSTPSEPVPTAPQPSNVPTVPDPPSPMPLGESCGKKEHCISGLCLDQATFGFPLGMCSARCNTTMDCIIPGNSLPACVEGPAGAGVCLPKCGASAGEPVVCRAAYQCTPARAHGAPGTVSVCAPEGSIAP